MDGQEVNPDKEVEPQLAAEDDEQSVSIRPWTRSRVLNQHSLVPELFLKVYSVLLLNLLHFGPEAFQISSWFSYKEFFLCHVPLSQQVHGTHAKIVVMIQLDTSINT